MQIYFFQKKSHVNFVFQKYKSETGCINGRKCFFRHVEAEEKPSKKSKKSGVKGSLALVEESTQLGCVSMILIRENLFSVKRENWDQNAPSNSPTARGTTSKFGK